MITEIQTKIKEHLPLHIDEIHWNGASLLFRGTNWHFEAITAWRLISNNKILCGSDTDTQNVIKFIKDASVVRIEPQNPAFPVDPSLLLDNGCILEIFSDTSYDTWTFRVPNAPIYDFSPYDEVYKNIQQIGVFPDIKNFLPLHIRRLSSENNKLILHGNKWNLTIPHSWRLIDQNNYIHGMLEEETKKNLDELIDINIDSVQFQSKHLPIDPVLNLSNGFRLEIFSVKQHELWVIKLPNGKEVYGAAG